MNLNSEQRCTNIALESAYAKGKKDAIDKACYLFKELKEWNIMYNGNFDKAVDAFRKAMEE